MRKFLISSAVLAGLASVFVNAYGQNAATGGTKKAVTPAAAAASQAEAPHKIALIDMGRVFKEYKKIEVLKEDWKSEFQVNEENAKKLTAQVQQVIEQMKEFKQGSPEFIKLEKQQTDLAAKLGVQANGSARVAPQGSRTPQDRLSRNDGRRREVFRTLWLHASHAIQLGHVRG